MHKIIKTACIIDDDPIFIFGTKKIMQMSKFCESFIIYNNGQTALEGLHKIIDSGAVIPDIILLDLNMPILDGWGFLAEFVKIPIAKKITIYIVTSSINPVDINRAKNYQTVSNYIVKPITRTSINEIIYDPDLNQ